MSEPATERQSSAKAASDRLKSSASKWNVFYERAWELRREYMSGLIAAGETDPLRIIKLMEHFERFNPPLGEYVKSAEGTDLVMSFREGASAPREDIRNVNLPKDNPANIQFHAFHQFPGGRQAIVRAAFLNEYHRTYAYTEYNHMTHLVDYIHDKKFDAVIELGSGYSQNLVKLFYEGGPKIPYYGGEYTESGTECARMLAKLNGDIDLRNFVYDFNNPNYDCIDEYESVLVFTRHTIEQVKFLSKDTIPSIANIAKNVTCIHFEPFGYQIEQPGSPVDKEHKDMFVTNGWNRNLIARLLEAHHEQVIDLQFIGKNIVGSTDNGLNPTSIAVWHAKHGAPVSVAPTLVDN